MNSRTFFMIHGAIAIFFAAGLVMIPRGVAHIYGISAGPEAALGFRYFGVALLGVGLIFWLAKDTKDVEARNAILGGAGIANQVGLLVSLYGTTSGVMNILGWSVVIIYAGLIAGCIHFDSSLLRSRGLR
jgi:hypothetical protein